MSGLKCVLIDPGDWICFSDLSIRAKNGRGLYRKVNINPCMNKIIYLFLYMYQPIKWVAPRGANFQVKFAVWVLHSCKWYFSICGKRQKTNFEKLFFHFCHFLYKISPYYEGRKFITGFSHTLDTKAIHMQERALFALTSL